MLALSSAASLSSTGDTITVCAVFQVVVLKLRRAGATVTAPASELSGVMVTAAEGCEFSTRV